MSIQAGGAVCERFRVGGAGCQSVSCLQSGETGLTTPIGRTDMPYLVCVEWRESHTTLGYAHTVYPGAVCGHTVSCVQIANSLGVSHQTVTVPVIGTSNPNHLKKFTQETRCQNVGVEEFSKHGKLLPGLKRVQVV